MLYIRTNEGYYSVEDGEIVLTAAKGKPVSNAEIMDKPLGLDPRCSFKDVPQTWVRFQGDAAWIMRCIIYTRGVWAEPYVEFVAGEIEDGLADFFTMTDYHSEEKDCFEVSVAHVPYEKE